MFVKVLFLRKRNGFISGDEKLMHSLIQMPSLGDKRKSKKTRKRNRNVFSSKLDVEN